MPAPTRSFEVIEVLVRHQVEFMVVGMTAGTLQGAPAVTFDLDILYSIDQVNVLRQRLIEAKEKAGRDKDIAVLPLLRATLARKRQSLND